MSFVSCVLYRTTLQSGMAIKDAACIPHAEPGTLALGLVHGLCQIQVKDSYK